MGGNFMTGIPEILDVSIIRILMTDIKSSSNRTTVWIFSLIRKNFLVFKERIKIMTASSKVTIIICGTDEAEKFPGICVPSLEHQQSGIKYSYHTSLHLNHLDNRHCHHKNSEMEDKCHRRKLILFLRNLHLGVGA